LRAWRSIAANFSAAAGQRRNGTTMAPMPGTMPRVISGNCIEAVAVATIAWQRNASSSPPPSASPLTAATTGLSMRSR
jgi:hypothetical protein